MDYTIEELWGHAYVFRSIAEDIYKEGRKAGIREVVDTFEFGLTKEEWLSKLKALGIEEER